MIKIDNSPRWRCPDCGQRDDDLSAAWQHRINAHGVDPLKPVRRSAA